MAEPLALFAQKTLRKRGVEIILEDRLVAATSEKAILKSGVAIPCKTIVCTVPSTLPPVIQKLDCAKEKGKLLTNTGLELKDYEGQVWALGDCAVVKTVSGKEAPPTAQHAIREATTAATNIAAAIRGGPRAQFAFEGLGTLGSLGHGAAVAQILGVKLSGLLAWVLWRCIYLMKMPGLNRKTRIATDWMLHLLFPPDLAQTKLEPESRDSESALRARRRGVPARRSGRQRVRDRGRRVRRVARRKTAQSKLLATLKAGDYFGEMALLSDQSRNATIQARTAMNVLIIPKEDFDKLRHSVPAFGDVFRAAGQAARDVGQAPASIRRIPRKLEVRQPHVFVDDLIGLNVGRRFESGRAGGGDEIVLIHAVAAHAQAAHQHAVLVERQASRGKTRCRFDSGFDGVGALRARIQRVELIELEKRTGRGAVDAGRINRLRRRSRWCGWSPPCPSELPADRRPCDWAR